MKTKVIDNYLTKSYHKDLLDNMSGNSFPWYYESNLSYEKSKAGKENIFEFGFNHTFWDNQDGLRDTFYALFWKPALHKMQDTLNSNLILRSRGDMTMYANKVYEHAPHVDFGFPHFSAVYYLNDSDGDTIFYNKKTLDQDSIKNISDLKETKRVSPKANRLVIFDGDIIHTGSSPNKHKNRIIINSNFSKEG